MTPSGTRLRRGTLGLLRVPLLRIACAILTGFQEAFVRMSLGTRPSKELFLDSMDRRAAYAVPTLAQGGFGGAIPR